MNILALETSGQAGSVAVLQNGRLLQQICLPEHSRSTQQLAISMKAILAQTELAPKNIGLTAVALGPGSFTGLRVGVVSAKVFAWTVGCDIIGVDTLQAIAWNLLPVFPPSGQTSETSAESTMESTTESVFNPAAVRRVDVAMDCQRGQVIHQTFERVSEGTGTSYEPVSEEKTEDWDQWIEKLESDVWISGPYISKIESKYPGRLIVPESYRLPLAETVGRLAWYWYRRGRRDDQFQLLPRYNRPAAAEEKRLHQMNLTDE